MDGILDEEKDKGKEKKRERKMDRDRISRSRTDSQPWSQTFDGGQKFVGKRLVGADNGAHVSRTL